jgi:hypothetical protein
MACSSCVLCQAASEQHILQLQFLLVMVMDGAAFLLLLILLSQGYYEGAQLLQLAQWLASAHIEAEAPLLQTLSYMPWPYRPSLVLGMALSAATAAAAAAGVDPPSSPGSIAYWAAVATGGSGAGGYGCGLTPAEAGVVPLGPVLTPGGCPLPAAAQLMGPAELKRHRPNGYKGLLAPLLLGEAGEQ